MIKPDIIVEVEFYKTEDGGRKSPTDPNYFGCLFVIDNQKFDCRLLLNGIGSISPGETKDRIPVKFLNTELVMSKINLVNKFYLWDMRNIAEGIVKEIIANKKTVKFNSI